MIEVVPVDLIQQSGVAMIADKELQSSVPEFASKYLSQKFDPRAWAKIWAAQEGGKLVGLTAIQQCIDIGVFRSIDERASYAMGRRINDYLADQGMRGAKVFIHISEWETVEQRCPNRETVLQTFNAIPADRYLVEVR